MRLFDRLPEAIQQMMEIFIHFNYLLGNCVNFDPNRSWELKGATEKEPSPYLFLSVGLNEREWARFEAAFRPILSETHFTDIRRYEGNSAKRLVTMIIHKEEFSFIYHIITRPRQNAVSANAQQEQEEDHFLNSGPAFSPEYDNDESFLSKYEP